MKTVETAVAYKTGSATSMFSSTGKETGKVFDPHIMLRVCVMQKKQINMVLTKTFGT